MSEIIIDSGINLDRVAILENKELVEFFVEEHDNKRILGNIYKGRVVNVLPGMEAAFVDIGLEKNAFLHVKDAIPKEMLLNSDINTKNLQIRDVVKVGQEIIVQVIKEPLGTKGAKITTHITLPGRYIVLMPFTDYIGISSRIRNEEERERLRSLAEEVRIDKMGLILRTAAEGMGLEEIREDIEFLTKIYYKIEKERNLISAPRIVYKDLDLIHRTVRDLFTKEVERLVINDKEKYKSILELVELISPHLKSRVEFFDNDVNIFSHYGIDSMIKKALDKKVWLKSGGYIVIDETEALTSIDVNTGKYVGTTNLEDTVFKTNIEAAKEIAKQLRLRNIGGIIIIDFIDMSKNEDINGVLNCLENELKKDKTKAMILGITKLGLVEMTRKKVRERLSSKILMSCPCCNGTGNVYSYETLFNLIENEVKRIKLHTTSEAILLEINTSHYSHFMKDRLDYIKTLEDKYKIKIFLTSSWDIDINDIKIKKMGKIDELEKFFN